MRIALLLGWPTWTLLPKDTKKAVKNAWGQKKLNKKSTTSPWGSGTGGYKSNKTWGQPVNK